jgi:hypothetical protein
MNDSIQAQDDADITNDELAGNRAAKPIAAAGGIEPQQVVAIA